MRVLVVGAGRIARRHLDALLGIEGAKLAGIVDPQLDAARALGAEYGAEVAMSSMEEALGSVPVDHVIITAPTNLHHSLALSAIRHGKHVLVEKPITSTASYAAHLIAEASSAGVKLAAGQSLRFLPMFTWAREFIAAGELGDPIQAVERRLTYRSEVFPWWKDVPDFLVGHWGSHSIDLICHLLDDEPRDVYCVGRPTHDGGSIDDFSLSMNTVRGARFATHMSFASRYNVHDLVLIGTAHTLQFDCYTTVRCDDKIVMELPAAEMLSTGFEAQLRNFLDADDSAGLLSAAQTVLPSLAAIDAAAESMRTHSTVTIS